MFSQKSLLFLLIFLALQCGSPKKEITDGDLKRVLERVSIARINANLKASSGKAAPNDLVFFLEACTVYRLDPDSVFERLKLKNPGLYEVWIKEYEK
ncbi:hypothetical protein EHQ12_05020 [Leptospira gomenensis]|uniref:Uncharacterized protein n=1 Tax=Leptospira gomenensis TaxID=2484974 RepID=A0A5F1Z2U5_9LEPT|nr:hypothetical protein [Leptospira gomenensis]TGK28924.1 hypothetical protein EHQ17_16290 [Leptospira gomenensis]TGK40683.1 hypothetical protein EHQ07_17635 [Leptospira gomenensis]TGK42504.1 hypothetical protein EHQ12_05020 [Leptospira gomenensis]TGK68473.1 hypothetical protein EHQ13_00420 [Leptospira gomenensis]